MPRREPPAAVAVRLGEHPLRAMKRLFMPATSSWSITLKPNVS
jgi:hypothetical protein